MLWVMMGLRAIEGAGALALGADVLSGRVKVSELVERCLAAISEVEDDLHAFVTVALEEAQAEALRLDEELASGIWRGPLHGVPIAVKDNIATRSLRTTLNSRAFADFVPSEDAQCVKRLRSAGCVIVGKSNLNELAFSDPSEEDLTPPARNPLRPGTLAALSSSGSGAAVAAGLVPVALGTDGGGSIRLPASQMGLVGLRRGASGDDDEEWGGLSTVGILGKTGGDVRAVLDALEPNRAPEERLTSMDGIRVSVPWSLIDRVCTDADEREAFESSLDIFRRLGGKCCDIDMPEWEGAANATFMLLYAVLTARYWKMAGSSASGLGQSVRERILAGAFITLGDVEAARSLGVSLRLGLRAKLVETKSLAIATPVTPGVSYAAKSGQGLAGGVVFTAPVNLLGWCAVSVPVAESRGNPTGLQLAAPAGSERRLLDLATLLLVHRESKTRGSDGGVASETRARTRWFS